LSKILPHMLVLTYRAPRRIDIEFPCQEICPPFSGYLGTKQIPAACSQDSEIEKTTIVKFNRQEVVDLTLCPYSNFLHKEMEPNLECK
jgi:hypothetical protein